jgi:hypothetical protein
MIKFFRTKVVTPFNVIMVTVFFLATSCQKQRIRYELIYSGEELIRGAFFGEGVVAEKIPVLAGYYMPNYFSDANENQQIVEFYNYLINEIKINNPNIFSQFKDAVSSRKHNDIMNAIEIVEQEMFQASLKHVGTRDLALEQQYLSEIESIIQDPSNNSFSDINIKLGNYFKNKSNNGTSGPQELLAILIVFVLLIFLPEKSNGNGPYSKNTKLRKEMVVNNLINLNTPTNN